MPPWNHRENPGVTRYIASIQTSMHKFAATDAQITLHIYGTYGYSRAIELEKPPGSKSKKKLFRQGQKDLFRFNRFDLGEIRSIRLTSDNRKGKIRSHPEWNCQEVHICTNNPRKDWHFVCNAWLSKETGLSRDFFQNSAAIQTRSDSGKHFITTKRTPRPAQSTPHAGVRLCQLVPSTARGVCGCPARAGRLARAPAPCPHHLLVVAAGGAHTHTPTPPSRAPL